MSEVAHAPVRRNAQALFERQPAREKRRLLNFVLSNCSWEDGEVIATFHQPFDLLAETTANAARAKAGSGDSSSKKESWLAFLDTVRTQQFEQVLALAAYLKRLPEAA